MFSKVLIANRGAIACRIIRTLRRMGIASVAVYSEADRHSLHVRQADEAICIGPAPASQSYLDGKRILEVARETGAQAIHPGYGFLSENAEFASACEAAGIAFIGPTGQQMRDFGLKHTARELAQRNAVPLLPGTGLLADLEQARVEGTRIGYPVMLKSTAGGGGIGMQLCWQEQDLVDAFHSVERLARNNFSQGGIFLEKYVERARHIEVQIFGDGMGRVVALGERDCSVQRRNQKVIEETPAPGLTEAQREQLMAAAVRLGAAVQYRSAGTVEYVYDADSGEFYFLEVNTRLQVEHGVTEEVTGVDLVEWMVRVAAGETDFLTDYQHSPKGHAIQVRLYAEDPGKQFQPSPGLLTEARFPDGVRVDTWVETGTDIPACYDPMVAKVIAHADNREQARTQLLAALDRTSLHGIETNLAYLRQVLADAVYARGEQFTRYLDGFAYRPHTIEVLAPGTQSMIQDWPGRTGYWSIGVPPSGPMDALAFRLANRALGNPEGTAALELTVNGPSLRFNTDTVIALTGAAMQATLDGEPIELWKPITVPAGATLRMRAIQGAGSRGYLAVKGGFDVPDYMGSKSTFTLGQFGGHGGRTLRVGDVLRLHGPAQLDDSCAAIPEQLIPRYAHHWELRVLYGPHGAPDFFTDQDIQTFFATDWEVHYNSSRTGVRLIGPKPQWARTDGGEAGLHPSNIHDNAYAIGSIDFTGDMPVMLGPDGPSLGGFVCPATIVQADLWKMGQLRPGDTLRFQCISVEEANRLEEIQDAAIALLEGEYASSERGLVAGVEASPILHRQEGTESVPAVCYRQAGDRHLLVEYGPPVLDLDLRFRVHALMTGLQAQAIEGITDLTPGIRSLQVQYDSRVLTQAQLLELLRAEEEQLPAIDDMEVPSRIVHLPLSWDDAATRLAIEKYMQSVRPDAPWCPSNIEFIRRINGLDSIQQVQDILFEASYLVMGLGDVYLGAPVATPLDPRHRLVTTKYNPARTWTPENAVGIGGAYLCVYGMEGPGGYQFVGRTVQMWNRYRQTRDFTDGKQWLLRFFDQIRFYPVGEQELLQLREDFIAGTFQLRIEPASLKLRDYRHYLAEQAEGIAAFKQRQQAAFDAERERWQATGQAHYEADEPEAAGGDALLDIPTGCMAVASPVSGSVWEIPVKVGDRIEPGTELVIVEAMKMEIAVEADEGGLVREILCSQGSPVKAGQALVVIELDDAE
ncbi:MAG: urea carboxylase [Gammaproteobacteria bacterium]|nr:urea carboxylase [Gammaproteobacteria bacterium]